MDKELLQAYLDIFKIDPKGVTLQRVRRIGKNESYNNNIYYFIGVITAPAKIQEAMPTSNEMVELRNYVRTNYVDIGGPDVIQEVIYEVKKKDKKKKKKRFHFTFQLDARSVLGFEIVDGQYFIKVHTYGLFYN